MTEAAGPVKAAFGLTKDHGLGQYGMHGFTDIIWHQLPHHHRWAPEIEVEKSFAIEIMLVKITSVTCISHMNVIV